MPTNQIMTESIDVKAPINFQVDGDREAIAAAKNKVAIYDTSHWGKIRVSDTDRLRFLHNQSTADFQQLKPGQGCDTVFVTSTARTIDLATGLVLDDEVLLLVSPNRREYLLSWLDRYIFFADRVKLTDTTDRMASFSLIGPDSDRVIDRLGWGEMRDLSSGDHRLFSYHHRAVRVVVGSGFALPGYHLLCDRDFVPELARDIIDLGAIGMGESAWEALRIQQGRPKPDAELTEDYNPLEVGLWQTISFSKGCYIGQETIARLNTYQGVKQYLWGIKLAQVAPIGTPLLLDGEKVGILTSCQETGSGGFGLGYLRVKAGGVGLQVQIGDTVGEIVAVPFVSHQYPVL
jgi:hypothetical protein